jgi:hypothetical protein
MVFVDYVYFSFIVFSSLRFNQSSKIAFIRHGTNACDTTVFSGGIFGRILCFYAAHDFINFNTQLLF